MMMVTNKNIFQMFLLDYIKKSDNLTMVPTLVLNLNLMILFIEEVGSVEIKAKILDNPYRVSYP